jgi:hypothetical protein
MAFDENLPECIPLALARKKNVEETNMFGGVGFLLHGNMLVGVWKNSLIARLGLEERDKALLEPHVKPFDITGQAMKVWVLIAPDGIQKDADLNGWVQQAVKFVGKMPAK